MIWFSVWKFEFKVISRIDCNFAFFTNSFSWRFKHRGNLRKLLSKAYCRDNLKPSIARTSRTMSSTTLALILTYQRVKQFQNILQYLQITLTSNYEYWLKKERRNKEIHLVKNHEWIHTFLDLAIVIDINVTCKYCNIFLNCLTLW